MAADGDSVFISWWERNQTSQEREARISSENGLTFGLLLKLAANGTIGPASEQRSVFFGHALILEL